MAATVLITGANRGIGKEMATQAAKAGWQVIGTARDPGAVSDFDGALHALDVRSEEGHTDLAKALDGQAIDLLVCNAGIYPARGGLDAPGATAEAFSDAMLTHVAGPFFAARAFLDNLKAAPAPKIAIISSRMGSNAAAQGNGLVYRASKAAATNLASNLAVALRPEGIAVGAYHPGWVRTDMGGSDADVSVEDSAKGLWERFAALSLDTSGVFESYDGAPLAF